MFTEGFPPCSHSDRATQWLNLAGTSGGHPDDICSSSWFSISKESLPTASTGNLCQCLNIHCRNVSGFFSPVFKRNFQYFLLCPLPTVLQLVTSKKNLPLSSHTHTCMILANTGKVPRACSS